MESNSEPTLVPGIILSDTIIREHGTGKMSYIGCFQQIHVARFPAPFRPFFVTALVANLRPEVKSVNVTVRIEDPRTGHVLASSSIEAGFTSPPERHVVCEFPLLVQGLVFNGPGVYSVIVLVNNEQLGLRQFQVSPLTAQPRQIQ